MVVCGPVEGLFHLVAPLRRKTLDKLRPIVIMDDVLPLREQASFPIRSVLFPAFLLSCCADQLGMSGQVYNPSAPRKTLDSLLPIVIMDDVLPLREQASVPFRSAPIFRRTDRRIQKRIT